MPSSKPHGALPSPPHAVAGTLGYAKLNSSSGPLDFLFLLPRTFFPQTSMCLALAILQVCAQVWLYQCGFISMASSAWLPLTSLSKDAPYPQGSPLLYLILYQTLVKFSLKGQGRYCQPYGLCIGFFNSYCSTEAARDHKELSIALFQ